ncbi:TonB family protein [Phenylobacterium sp. J367]|uniref:TonB family protein n=1 Tax=Phenylobacterium sp. J367 TaxID=2898435 RepID=UPI0021512745|nr:TonB family protein [Phenylobacterium sp. J367]MCR5878855.1 TonB family protein [Phenylobacterium sp. J367]
MRPSPLAAVLIAGIALPALAADQYQPADWLRRPTAEMLRGVWPTEAWKKGQGGKAILECMVTLQGTLTQCRVASEEPKGSGFGAAAMLMTPQLLMKPARRNGQPVVDGVRLPFNFVMPGGGVGFGGNDTFGTQRMMPAAWAWPEAPSYQEVVAAYPEKAKAAGVGGVASLSCSIRGGELSACQLMREEPKGMGFAAAARTLSKRFRAPATDEDGKMLRAGVQIPFAFSPDMLTGADPAVGKPSWARLPTVEALAAAFPKETAVAGTVRVMLRCRVEQAGAVSNCVVEKEEPAGHGYGQAALKVAPDFRLNTWTTEGLPTVGAYVRIPIRFELGAKPAETPPVKSPG